MKRTKMFAFVILIALLSVVVVACAQPTPEVVTVKETVIVKEEVEKVVTQEVEVEVTKEVEVVKEIEIVKEVTPLPKPLENSEAPMLEAMVKQGVLPPLAERLPDEPLVLEPVDEIGEYGGVWRQAFLGPNDRMQNVYYLRESPMAFSLDYTTLQPNVFKNWEANDDATVWTFYLREGMKWSDGEPFTTDDVMFWFNDFILNDELNPAPPAWLQAGGEMGVFEKVDDTTFTVTFSQPYAIFDIQSSGMYGNEMYQPAHYLKQYHPNYASEEELTALMEKEEFDSWVDMYKDKVTRFSSPGAPCLRAWCEVNTDDQPVHILERNPYYWAVDTAGNQLPYIDRIERTLTPDNEGILLRALAGEIDFGARRFASADNRAVLADSAEQGGYHFVDDMNTDANYVLHLNFAHEDPVLNELFNTRDFRIALSLGIDRDEICQLVEKGLCVPRQAVVGPHTRWYDESQNTYVEYDPDKANELLDGLGLAERDADGFRLRPDGERLSLVILSHGEKWVPHAELIKETWGDLGIDVVVKSADRKLWREQVHSYQHDIGIYYGGFGHYGAAPYYHGTFFTTSAYHESPGWALWYETGGEQGIEPPAEVKELQALYDQIMAEPSAEKQDEMIAQALAAHAENIWSIGILNLTPNPYHLAKDNMGNVPDPIGMYGRALKTSMFYYK